jgi:hypothetical protein
LTKILSSLSATPSSVATAIMKIINCVFLLSAILASSSSVAFVVQPSASKMPSTQSQLLAQTSSRAEFIRNVATASIASVMVSVPKIAGADDAGDLSMPTPEEQKAQEVSKDTDCI